MLSQYHTITYMENSVKEETSNIIFSCPIIFFWQMMIFNLATKPVQTSFFASFWDFFVLGGFTFIHIFRLCQSSSSSLSQTMERQSREAFSSQGVPIKIALFLCSWHFGPDISKYDINSMTFGCFTEWICVWKVFFRIANIERAYTVLLCVIFNTCYYCQYLLTFKYDVLQLS